MPDNNKDYNGKIIVIKGTINKADYDMYSSKGAIGIVAGGFDYQSLSDILGYKLGHG